MQQYMLGLEEALQTYFHYGTFRIGQKEIIQDVLAGHDVLGILPTGSGKSICYQLPARIQDGLTIVVSPLISLMIDQVKQLKAANFKEVVALNSFMTPGERRNVYQNLASYKLIYVSPELLQQRELIKKLKQVCVRLFVIDEAHCISQWGHEFRPDYLKLAATIKELNNPTVLALSATATPEVQADIMKVLCKPEMIKRIYPMDRENIAFILEEVANDEEKIDRLISMFNTYHVPSLIYFTSRAAAESTASILSQRLANREVAFYHGGMDQVDRVSIQQQFMNDQLDIICCTSAFGMGINKSNIRLIIHFHIPLQLEAYIQEVGRAGRDGKSSVGVLLFSRRDAIIPNHIIQHELPDENDLQNVFHYLYSISQTSGKIPIDQQIEEQLQLNEIHWKFFKYQLEKHGMINNNYIIYQENNWKSAYHSIEQVIRMRMQYKEEKLQEVLSWVQSKDCLRRDLYKSFQETYPKSMYQCCSNCGFSWAEWEPENTNSTKIKHADWRRRLKNLLLVGEVHETN
ncbi:ATP-dependent DNA helicase RecQ [Oceanobacillus sp. FSL K6-2867]|uniref:RecQ family ATP-dependent DNA helicase n=1 Tax=Oceanobacillus sp. FSL K6-2867 TaxID=2954748 RepID=UPI0030DBA46C